MDTDPRALSRWCVGPRAFVCAVAVASILCACVTRGALDTTRSPRTSARSSEGSAALVAQPEQLDVAPFLAEMRPAVAANAPNAVDRLVRTWPDRALHALRHATTGVEHDALAGAMERALGAGSTLIQSCDELRFAAERALAEGRADDALASSTRAFELARDRSCAQLALECGLVRVRAMSIAKGPERAHAALHEALVAGCEARDPRFLRLALDLRPRADDFEGTRWTNEGALVLDLAEIEFTRGELALALLDASRATTLGAADSRLDARLLRARVLAALGRRGDACDEANALVAASSASVAPSSLVASGSPVALGAWALLGSIAGELGEYPRARECLQNATAGELDWPGRGRALSDLGVVEFASKHPELAETLFRRALTSLNARGDRPGTARTLRLLAAAQRALGAEDRARATDDRARAAELAAGFLPAA